MSQVVKKMFDEVPRGFNGFNVFLATYMAEPPFHFCTAIQAIFFLSFCKVTQRR